MLSSSRNWICSKLGRKSFVQRLNEDDSNQSAFSAQISRLNSNGPYEKEARIFFVHSQKLVHFSWIVHTISNESRVSNQRVHVNAREMYKIFTISSNRKQVSFAAHWNGYWRNRPIYWSVPIQHPCIGKWIFRNNLSSLLSLATIAKEWSQCSQFDSTQRKTGQFRQMQNCPHRFNDIA